MLRSTCFPSARLHLLREVGLSFRWKPIMGFSLNTILHLRRAKHCTGVKSMKISFPFLAALQQLSSDSCERYLCCRRLPHPCQTRYHLTQQAACGISRRKQACFPLPCVEYTAQGQVPCPQPLTNKFLCTVLAPQQAGVWKTDRERTHSSISASSLTNFRIAQGPNNGVFNETLVIVLPVGDQGSFNAAVTVATASFWLSSTTQYDHPHYNTELPVRISLSSAGFFAWGGFSLSL